MLDLPLNAVCQLAAIAADEEGNLALGFAPVGLTDRVDDMHDGAEDGGEDHGSSPELCSQAFPRLPQLGSKAVMLHRNIGRGR